MQSQFYKLGKKNHYAKMCTDVCDISQFFVFKNFSVMRHFHCFLSFPDSSFPFHPSTLHPGEHHVLVLVMLCRRHSVWGFCNINADTHTHTSRDTQTGASTFKLRILFFFSPRQFAHIIRRLGNIIYLAACLGRKSFARVNTQRCVHTLEQI